MRKFDPWVGAEYSSTGLLGLRVLVLGESHYGLPPEKRDFTTRVIRKWGQTKRSRFFSVTQRLVSLDRSRGYIPARERKAFWEKVAFYNFVQSFVGKTSRIRPTQTMWKEASGPYRETVKELDPQVIVVLGDATRSHLPEVSGARVFAYVRHPSGRGFRYATSQPLIQAAFDRAHKNDQLRDNGGIYEQRCL